MAATPVQFLIDRAYPALSSSPSKEAVGDIKENVGCGPT